RMPTPARPAGWALSCRIRPCPGAVAAWRRPRTAWRAAWRLIISSTVSSALRLPVAEAGLVTADEDAAERAYLRRLVVFGFLVRAAVALVLEWTGYSRRFAPDEATYVADGWPIGMYWAGDLLVKPWRLTLDQPLAYFYLNGASYCLFGPTQIPLKMLNAFVGAFSARYLHVLARELFGVRVARRATTLFVYFPSLVLWSALNIRDAWVVFLILYTSAKSLQLARGYSHVALVQLLLAVYAMTHFRDYLFYVVALPPVVAVLIARRGHLVRNFVIASLAALAVVVLVQQGVVRKKTASRMRLDGLSQTGSGIASRCCCSPACGPSPTRWGRATSARSPGIGHRWSASTSCSRPWARSCARGPAPPLPRAGDPCPRPAPVPRRACPRPAL